MRKRRDSPPSSSRAAAKATTRRRIVEAAMDVFACRGYHAARMDAIATAAGVSKGALYFHFPGKLDLFSALVDEFAGELASDVQQGITGPGDGLTRVEAALVAAIRTFSRRRTLARIVLVEAASLGPPYAAKRREVLQRFAALIRFHLEQAVCEGGLPPLDANLAALAWLGAVSELVTRWLDGELPDLEGTVPALSSLLLRSVGARGGAARLSTYPPLSTEHG